MARVLSSISLDSPASPVSASTGNSFSFAGTPSLSGGGGVQRYDFRWEIDQGAGFVPITGATNLTTADTNPVVNSNSQTQNAITVTCAVAGSYTIRMAGAPSTGGSYTVFSPTQTVEVAAGITGTMSVQESGSDTFSATGTVTDAAVTGTMAVQETGSDIFSAVGEVPRTGTLAVQETGSDTFSATGTVTEPGITGTLSVQETGSDSFVGAGEVRITGTLSVIETGSDTFSASSTQVDNNGRYTKRRTALGSFSVGI